MYVKRERTIINYYTLLGTIPSPFWERARVRVITVNPLIRPSDTFSPRRRWKVYIVIFNRAGI